MKLKLVSWNVNGIRAIKRKGLFDYIEKEQPDILCMQETKIQNEQLEHDLLYPNGYYTLYHSSYPKKGYSGTAIFSKIKPNSTSVGFGLDKFDCEGRVTQANFEKFTLLNVYFPNGRRDKERVQYKLDFYKDFFAYCENLRKEGHKLIICGDFNTAHKEIDLARPKENENVSGFLQIEREWLDKIITLGYIDSFRVFNKEGNHYTWWSMQTKARDRNIGWRIDYFFITEDLLNNLLNAYIQKDILGSDHCPVCLELDI